MIIKQYNIFLISIMSLWILSCHPTVKLQISNGEKKSDKYFHKESNLFSISINAKYTISKTLEIIIKIINQSDKDIYYYTDNLNLKTKVLSFRDRFVTVKNDTSIIDFNNQKVDCFKIKSQSYIKFEIVYMADIKKLSLKQKSKLWPWPKNEKMNLNLGKIKLDNKTFNLKSVDIIYNLQ